VAVEWRILLALPCVIRPFIANANRPLDLQCSMQTALHWGL